MDEYLETIKDEWNIVKACEQGGVKASQPASQPACQLVFHKKLLPCYTVLTGDEPLNPLHATLWPFRQSRNSFELPTFVADVVLCVKRILYAIVNH